jgi:tetratricopeptide (TPR) repeat protein
MLSKQFSKQGYYCYQAEEIYVRALAGNEKALGPDHTSTLLTVNNLGNLYGDQGKLAEAEQMYVRALAGNEKALGPDHTSKPASCRLLRKMRAGRWLM